MLKAFPVMVLAVMALINLGRGAIHAFAPDGGAISIAGLSFGNQGPTLLSLFATLGFGQMVMGGFQAYIVLHRRDLVSLFLAFQLATTLMAMVNLYLWRPLLVTVPGQPFNLALLAIQALAFGLAVRSAQPSPTKP
jgi:hypothetical protein